MKDNDKILIAKSLLKVTFIMICISLVLKLVGLNILEADVNSKILLYISDFLKNHQHIDIIYNFLLLIIQNYIFLRLSCKNENRKNYYIGTALITALTYFTQWFMGVKLNLDESNLMSFYFLATSSLLIIFAILIDIKVKNKNKTSKSIIKSSLEKVWVRIKKPIVILMIMSVYQLVVLFLRSITYIETYDTLYNFLLNFDYTVLLLVTYFLFLKKDIDVKLKSLFDFSITKLFDEKPSIDDVRLMISELKENINKFKMVERTEKIVMIIYVFLFILSELFNLALVVFIASLNHVLIECFFVVSSFLITRKVFGAFHFDAAWKCWLISNVSFFILNKITLSVGITFVIPILCGIILAYVTSRFIKDTTTTPYRGMSERELKGLCRNKHLNKFEMDLLTDFYCNRESITKLTYKYNYSQTAIVRFKKLAMKKIEV